MWGQTARPRNILFAIADDWGYGHAGAYGCRWIKTPAFDRVAKEGLLFSRAYANAGHRNFCERYLRGEQIKAGWVNDSDFEPHPLD